MKWPKLYYEDKPFRPFRVYKNTHSSVVETARGVYVKGRSYVIKSYRKRAKGQRGRKKLGQRVTDISIGSLRIRVYRVSKADIQKLEHRDSTAHKTKTATRRQVSGNRTSKKVQGTKKPSNRTKRTNSETGTIGNAVRGK